MEEKTYIGMTYGSFVGDDGAEHNYCNVFFIEDFAGEQSDTRHFAGRSAGKYRCTDPLIMHNIAPGTNVTCYFDSKGRVAFVQRAEVAKAKD
ncbi:MAG: hypothetical protein LUE22_03660 [Oscillospiraceae bacterium]|nr:hypothetical protein [Oscillospiraceae bacterium]